MTFGFDGARGTNIRPAHKAAVSSWAKDESAPGANDGTVLTASWANRIAGNIRRLAVRAGVSLTETSDDDLANCIVALAAAGLVNATETLSGVVELATVAEAVAGSDTQRAVTPAGVAAVVAALINSAPGALNTLDELAAALGDDANFAATMTAALAAKAPLASPALTGTPSAPTAAADTNSTQLASTAFVLGQAGSTSPAMDGVAAAGSSTRFSRQDHVHPTDTSRAPLASPSFTGTPTAPTAAPGTNTTQLATTAFVAAAVAAVPGLSDGDKGDITISGSGAAWAVDSNAITYAKMQDVSATSRVLGRKTAGAGDPEEITLSELLDFIGSAAQGDILYRGPSGWARLGAGTNGQYLQTQGAAQNPQWASVAAASDTVAGLVELATNAEAEAGSDTQRAVTPAGMLAAKSGVYDIPIPAAAMYGRTTNGAASGTVETSTNRNIIKSLDFDATTQEFAQFAMRMPKQWNEGTITASFTWSHASTATNFGVVWALEAVSFSDNEDRDAAFGTAQQIADTGGTTNRCYITSQTPAITIAGSPAARDLVMFQVKRVPADASDTLAVDARLEQVTLHIGIDAFTDD